MIISSCIILSERGFFLLDDGCFYQKKDAFLLNMVKKYPEQSIALPLHL